MKRTLSKEELKFSLSAKDRVQRRIKLVEYNLKVKNMALEEGLEISYDQTVIKTKQDKSALEKELEQAKGTLQNIEDQLKNGVTIKKQVDYSKIKYTEEFMRDFIIGSSLEKEYLSFCELTEEEK